MNWGSIPLASRNDLEALYKMVSFIGRMMGKKLVVKERIVLGKFTFPEVEEQGCLIMQISSSSFGVRWR